MSSAFANRRKARRIVGDEADEGNSNGEPDSDPIVKRPQSKPKQKSKLRLSFGPSETSMTEDSPEESQVITPKKAGIKRRELGKSSLQKSWTPTTSSGALPVRVGQDENRPSYNKDYLQELRNSTPSTPKTGSAPASEDEREKSLDIAAKFGELVQVSSKGATAIPTEAEIQEKKQRRARLAKEQDYISLHDAGPGIEGDEGDEWSLAKQDKEMEMETRLVRDDEDFAEGFDEFVEDGRIAMGKRAELEYRRKRRSEMKELINDAEETSDEDSETERRAAYDDAQTRAGMEGSGKYKAPEIVRSKTPPKITPIPTLAMKLAEFRASIHAMEQNKHQLVNRLEDLRKEKVEIAEREVEIQRLLKEAGDKYEKLRAEVGISSANEKLLTGRPVDTDRGLENLGAMIIPTPTPNADPEED
ncbi:hypothetical protein FQN57_005442 [Myotisia sp. PD_48]|nr:hypothetical protein FQN57_005442 [Myotisia sp. PD_48]